jgi:hypothetical protein
MGPSEAERVNAFVNVSHCDGVPGGVVIMTAIPNKTTAEITMGTMNLRKYVSLISTSIYYGV